MSCLLSLTLKSDYVPFPQVSQTRRLLYHSLMEIPNGRIRGHFRRLSAFLLFIYLFIFFISFSFIAKHGVFTMKVCTSAMQKTRPESQLMRVRLMITCRSCRVDHAQRVGRCVGNAWLFALVMSAITNY